MTTTLEKSAETQPAKPIAAKKIGVPKEIFAGEARVAATPDTAQKLQKLGFEVLIEANAGANANFPDEAFEKANCRIVADAETLWREADIILKVRAPEMNADSGKHEAELLAAGKTLISFIYPAQNKE